MVENTRIRIEMKKDIPNTQLDRLADYVVYEILEYIRIY